VAYIHKERTIAASPEEVWDALSDWGALHERLAPGFVTDTQLDGDDRLVTFFTGTVVRERLIARSDEERRLSWSIVDGPYAHHNGVARVDADEDGTARFIWEADLLPDALAEATGEMMERGMEAVKERFEGTRPGSEGA
jgi:uncharacterized protein YndB with AHSA1/START domain